MSYLQSHLAFDFSDFSFHTRKLIRWDEMNMETKSSFFLWSFRLDSNEIDKRNISLYFFPNKSFPLRCFIRNEFIWILYVRRPKRRRNILRSYSFVLITFCNIFIRKLWFRPLTVLKRLFSLPPKWINVKHVTSARDGRSWTLNVLRTQYDFYFVFVFVCLFIDWNQRIQFGRFYSVWFAEKRWI